MTERQFAKTFSKQVDSLLVGQTPPGLDEDPLLSLAAEMVATPALDPPPAFRQRLRRQLLESLPREKTILSHRRWSFASFAGIAVTLLLALALTLLWTPRSPSVAEVLARAADAVAIVPGQIEYCVSKIDLAPIVSGTSETVYSNINEYWARTDTTPDGNLTSVEVAGNVYAADDVDRTRPLMQHYSTSSKLCWLDLDPSRPSRPNPGYDDEGCTSLYSTSTRNNPDPMAIHAGESFQDWINRMQANVEEIEFHEDTFNDRPVYSLTYRELGYRAQSPITVNSTTTGTVVAWSSESVPRTVITYTVTRYIDRETYLPVGGISISPDPYMVLTYTVLEYRVLNPTDLDSDPFVWPPKR